MPLFKEDCRKCHGSGIEEESLIKIYRPCYKCGGSGNLDWVTNVIERAEPVDHKIAMKIIQKNLFHLHLKLTEEYIKVGYDVLIQPKPMKYTNEMTICPHPEWPGSKTY